MISDYYEDIENDSTPKLRPTRRHIRQPVSVPDELPPRVYECYKREVCPLLPIPIVPMVNVDGYIRDMGMTGEKAELFRKLYTVPPEPEPVIKEKYVLQSIDPLHVFTHFKVLKSGTVRIKFTVPMEPVYTCQKIQKTAPFLTRVGAAKAFGYPDSVLAKMVLRNDNRVANVRKLDTFIDDIFGKAVGAKVSKPKAKTVQELLNSKFKKKPAKKYS